MPEVTIALSAIPNTGKTTLFNRLTGASQTVGNWPGVTVRKRTGRFRLDGYDVSLVDLPGAYSVTPTTEEERIVLDFLLRTPPDVVLNILDARNLYRGLGLTLQLARSGLPTVVVVNMMDEARRSGISIDPQALSEHLGTPVIPMVARSGEGIEQLGQALLQVLTNTERPRPPAISFPPVLEESIMALARRIEALPEGSTLSDTFLATRLLQGGKPTEDLVQREPRLATIAAEAGERRRQVEAALGSDILTTCAQCRFSAARGLVLEATRNLPRVSDAVTERLDAVLLHRVLGLPLFFLLMLGVFQGIFALGTPLQDGVAALFRMLGAWLKAGPAMAALPPLLASFIVDGLIQGLGVIVAFFPIIAIFFVFMSLIEDSGYIARAAFLMDRLMHVLKLDGKAFISILLGYGCNVPAVLGTRILSGRHSRIVTMLLIPFSLCSARLQVFVFVASILFAPRAAAGVVFAMYVGSFAAVILVGLLLRLLRVGGRPEPFIMELPPYRVPMLRSVALRAWQEVRAFLYRAATLILLGVVGVWLLTHYPTDVPPGSVETLAGQLGQLASPLFTPLGIQWRETVALLFGFVAKEIVIGAMAVIHGGGDLAGELAARVTPLQGVSFMVFTLLYTPCVATVAAIRAESRSWKVTGLSILLGLVLAWLASFTVYQTGRLMGFE
jgi:ferrous iron transport protein B